MVVSGETKKEKLIIVNCDCGCNEEIHISKYQDVGLPNDYYISIMESKFYSMQGGMWSKFKHRIKMVWRAITGKEYKLCEICLTEQDIDNLIQKLENIKKD
jgi:hypothetical protein